ncbi:hypothetical protein [Streptomyces kaniharaensis]|uniref:hypothetical protein n=1 Tax=Streptomyces kaniharaensis TaxID=212423 RepID=UPI00129561C1|nr:hypothetical protein [Streptomyces kaniharaensis]
MAFDDFDGEDDDDDFSLQAVLRSQLEEYLRDLEDLDEIDTEELASQLASTAESHFGM